MSGIFGQETARGMCTETIEGVDLEKLKHNTIAYSHYLLH